MKRLFTTFLVLAVGLFFSACTKGGSDANGGSAATSAHNRLDSTDSNNVTEGTSGGSDKTARMHTNPDINAGGPQNPSTVPGLNANPNQPQNPPLKPAPILAAPSPAVSPTATAPGTPVPSPAAPAPPTPTPAPSSATPGGGSPLK